MTRSFKTAGTTPMHIAASAVRDYAAKALADYGDDESPIALLGAAQQTINASELIHIGHAILARHDSLCDAGYRIGEPHADPAIQMMADALATVG
jgi:hypothetical protein